MKIEINDRFEQFFTKNWSVVDDVIGTLTYNEWCNKLDKLNVQYICHNHDDEFQIIIPKQTLTNLTEKHFYEIYQLLNEFVSANYIVPKLTDGQITVVFKNRTTGNWF